MSEIKVSVVSSNEEIYSGEAKMVYATGSLGELGIAPGHTPLLTGLAPGPVRLETENGESDIMIILEENDKIMTFKLNEKRKLNNELLNTLDLEENIVIE